MTDLIQKSKIQYAKIEKARESLRFKRVIGRLMRAKLLQIQASIPLYSGKLSINDYIWAAQFEPRIFELLPALVIKKPSLFKDMENCPKDLEQIVKDIKNGQAAVDYKGIPAKNYLRWVLLVGHRGREASQLKSFRFTSSDSELLHFLSLKGYCEIGAVREGLRLLVEKTKQRNSEEITGM